MQQRPAGLVLAVGSDAFKQQFVSDRLAAVQRELQRVDELPLQVQDAMLLLTGSFVHTTAFLPRVLGLSMPEFLSDALRFHSMNEMVHRAEAWSGLGMPQERQPGGHTAAER